MKGLCVAVFFGLFFIAAREPAALDKSVPEAKADLIEAVWHYHMSVIRQVVDARDDAATVIDLGAFRRSVDAIETLTIIPSNTGTRLGRLPSPELTEAMRQWDDGYALNGQGSISQRTGAHFG